MLSLSPVLPTDVALIVNPSAIVPLDVRVPDAPVHPLPKKSDHEPVYFATESSVTVTYGPSYSVVGASSFCHTFTQSTYITAVL